jgi:predicted nucleic acid-binding protein
MHELDPAWEVPVLWKSEFLNVVALYFRKKLITYQQAVQSIEYAEKLVNHHEHVISPVMTMEVIAGSACTAYDCEFVALAKSLETKFVTFDKQVIKDFSEIALKPEDYIAQIS